MALITCPECGKQISDQANACPNCGYPIHISKPQFDFDDDDIQEEEYIPVKNKSRSIINLILFILIVITISFMVKILSGNETSDIANSEMNVVQNPDGSLSIQYGDESNVDNTEQTENTTTNEIVEEVWQLRNYVDEFNKPTSQQYITTIAEGTFSNSATNNSDLLVKILVEKSIVSFELYEYGSNKVNNIFRENEKYDIAIRDTLGIKHSFEGYIKPKGDRLYIEPLQMPAVLDLLKRHEIITFYIEEVDNRLTNYLFEVESANLRELYDSLPLGILEKYHKNPENNPPLSDFEKTLIGTYDLKYIKEGTRVHDGYGTDAKLELKEDRSFELSLYDISTLYLKVKGSHFKGYWEYKDGDNMTLRILPESDLTIWGEPYKDREYDSEEIRNGNGIVVTIPHNNDYYRFYFEP